jgi:hypothetical protein
MAAIAEVVAVIDSERTFLLETGVPRPDVALAYPTLLGIEHAGFSGVLPVSDLSPGVHTVTVRISVGNGDQAEVEREFEVAPIETAAGDLLPAI